MFCNFFQLGNTIMVHRGDSLQIPFSLNMGSKLHPIECSLNTDDTIYFAVMEPNQQFEDALVKKVITHETPTTPDGKLILSLDPKDTQYLIPGTYYYTLKLEIKGELLNSSSVITFVPQRKFCILP